MPREIVLELSPAEARALHACLADQLQFAHEVGLGADERPGYVHRLARVQRLLADGLNYLHPARSA